MIHSQVNVVDAPGSDIAVHFDAVVEFIHAARQTEGCNVFVHCFRGVSRSAALILAYLFISESELMPRKDGTAGQLTVDLTPDELLDYLRERRPCVDPNPGFWRQLLRVPIGSHFKPEAVP